MSLLADCDNGLVGNQLRDLDDRRAALGAAVGTDLERIDAELAAVIYAWPTLPEAVRAGIVAMIDWLASRQEPAKPDGELAQLSPGLTRSPAEGAQFHPKMLTSGADQLQR